MNPLLGEVISFQDIFMYQNIFRKLRTPCIIPAVVAAPKCFTQKNLQNLRNVPTLFNLINSFLAADHNVIISKQTQSSPWKDNFLSGYFISGFQEGRAQFMARASILPP